MSPPISPIQQAPPSAAASTVGAPNATANNFPPVATSGSTIFPTKWLPFTLRWYFLLLPIVVSSSLGIVIACLCWYSQQNYGLGADDGSSAILFGWRFTPTLVAVLYTQVTVIVFEDSKRTEPFARLAKAPPEGATAHGTLLQKPKAWYAILVDAAFKRKIVGKTSCTLICSTIINVLALLIISPLSAALLASDEVLVPRDVNFTGLTPNSGTQLLGNTTRETYFRTMAALTRNTSTSVWNSDDSITFPVWPASDPMQIGPKLVSSLGSWQAETLTLKHEYDCEDMPLVSAELRNKTYSAPDWHYSYPFNGTQPMVSYKLASRDNCEYELDVHPSVDLAYFGGVRWSKATEYLSDGGILNVDNRAINANVSSRSPYSRIKTSPQCQGRDVILVATPWTSPLALMPWETLSANRTYQKSAQFRMRALLCNSSYTMRRHTPTVSISYGGATSLESDAEDGQVSGTIPQTLVNSTHFQDMTFGWNQWRLYVAQGDVNYDAALGPKPELKGSSEPQKRAQVPEFIGLGLLLGTLSSWNVTDMLNDPDLDERAARIKGRFFTENIRDSFTKEHLVQTQVLQGRIISVETRVVILRETGIALATLFFVSFVLFLVVLWSSRLARRPLNLPSDPASTVGLSILLDPRLTSLDMIKRAHGESKRGVHSVVREGSFFTSFSTLYQGSSSSASSATAAHKTGGTRDWRPRALRLKNLFTLGTFLGMILTALLIMNTFSAKSGLYQKAFTYEADLSRFGLSISSFAPISIAPTVISIAITLWWDQLDMTFRVLQPYITMSRAPTSMRSGAGLTYRSKTWMGAAVKAARHRHWVLFLVALGSTLCQVLTVSMSALFERKPANSLSSVTLNRTLDVRFEPVLTTIDVLSEPDVRFKPSEHANAVLSSIYSGSSYNWLYRATIQLSLGGPQLAWTRDEWNFIPVDISTASPAINDNPAVVNSTNNRLGLSTNVTLQTTAMRAWLECHQIDEIANRSTWLSNITAQDLPPDVTTGDFKSGYQFNHFVFENTTSSTPILGQDRSIQCCMNGTTSNPQDAVIGYWSPLQKSLHPDWAAIGHPYQDRSWPLPFVTKWIVGEPIALRNYNRDIILYKDPPVLQAALCQPVIDTAEATVTLDAESHIVYSYELLREPESLQSAWSDVFVRHDISDSGSHYTTNYTGPLNMTTSFGVLFADAMFGSGDRSPLGNAVEDLDDNTSNIREPSLGQNMDLMTYSMFAIADKDPQALLNYTALTTYANRTFQTFFQHFVNERLTVSEGSWAYQKLGDTSLEGLGQAVDENGTAIAERVFIRPETNPTVTASVSKRIQTLHMNSVATYLSAGLIIWLIATTAIVTWLQRRYTGSMLRNVELIADVLVLVAGSENFLSLVQERGLDLKRDTEAKTMLGWFKDRDGEVRWGIEVVGGRNPVEWVTAPQKDFG
ncbi:hypothetical protein P171DRAFT_477814 [Karstenula rhodostoma CBS 690.94]|uniref:Uncharacterized protein n=1 Tax=Karstenula rhodostoma CBS 690.94 TaxID=1392251 RepID=A0A9P4P404_9PLEO|nr:hypothetical protein P171DRAFT_477814 [Karstenula rhodostoma CBS 690.94]